MPWKPAGRFFFAATLTGTSIRLLVDPAPRGWVDAVEVTPPNDVVLHPAAGADPMRAAWPAAIAQATTLDTHPPTPGDGEN